jgi:hypothetical protein
MDNEWLRLLLQYIKLGRQQLYSQISWKHIYHLKPGCGIVLVFANPRLTFETHRLRDIEQEYGKNGTGNKKSYRNV